MSDPSGGDLEVFLKFVRDYRSSVAASLAWVVYDWVLCLEDEVELIWRSPNTPPKFMYLFSRYFGLITVSLLANEYVLTSYCQERLIFQAISYDLLLLSLELSLMLRVYAIWERNKYVTWAICTTFFLSQASVLGLAVGAYSIIIPSIRRFPEVVPISPQACYVSAWPLWYRLIWIPTLVFETLLFVLNTAKCVSTVGWMRAPTLSRLFRDGTVYFAALAVILLINTIVQYSPNNVIGFMMDTWIPAAMSFAGSRLLLSIRTLYTERQHVGNVTVAEAGVMPSFVHPQYECPTTNEDVEMGVAQRRHTYPPLRATQPLIASRKSLDYRIAGTSRRPTCNPRSAPDAEVRDIVGTETKHYGGDWLSEWDCR